MGGLRIYDLGNGRRVLVHILVYRGITVRNLGYGGITVCSLRVGYTLTSEVNSKATWVYRINLVKWVRYKARDPIKFRRSKKSTSSFNII